MAQQDLDKITNANDGGNGNTIPAQSQTIKTEAGEQDANYMSDDEWANPPPLEGERLEIHLQNVHKARKLLFSVTILNLGIVTLIAVIIYKLFRHS